MRLIPHCHHSGTEKIFAYLALKPRDKASEFLQHGGQTVAMRTAMIRLGQQIRLTRREIERFKKITDLVPVNIRTLADLAAYIDQCKAHYWGVSRETQFLHWLIDREYDRCRMAA